VIRIYGKPGEGYGSQDTVLDEDLFRGLRAGSPELSAQFLEQLGHGFAAKGWDSKAADVYVRLVRISPKRSASALSSLGEIFARNGRLDAALVAWQQAMRTDSTIAAVHNNLGAAHWSLGNQDSALVHWENGWRIAPGDSGLYRNLEMAFTARGQLDRLEGLKRGAVR
jgi:tetratricopeptide (TPR) repeat protein